MNYRNGSMEPRRRPHLFHHAGFRYGFLGGMLMWGIHLILLLLFGGTNQGDVLAWVFQMFIYIFMGRAAAQKHYDSQRNEFNATRGVKGAGTGAALVTSVLSWLFIIVRGIVRDAFGIIIMVEPVGLFCAMVIDIVIALGVGTWAGKTIEKKYQTQVI